MRRSLPGAIINNWALLTDDFLVSVLPVPLVESVSSSSGWRYAGSWLFISWFSFPCKWACVSANVLPSNNCTSSRGTGLLLFSTLLLGLVCLVVPDAIVLLPSIVDKSSSPRSSSPWPVDNLQYTAIFPIISLSRTRFPLSWTSPCVSLGMLCRVRPLTAKLPIGSTCIKLFVVTLTMKFDFLFSHGHTSWIWFHSTTDPFTSLLFRISCHAPHCSVTDAILMPTDESNVVEMEGENVSSRSNTDTPLMAIKIGNFRGFLDKEILSSRRIDSSNLACCNIRCSLCHLCNLLLSCLASISPLLYSPTTQSQVSPVSTLHFNAICPTGFFPFMIGPVISHSLYTSTGVSTTVCPVMEKLPIYVTFGS